MVGGILGTIIFDTLNCHCLSRGTSIQALRSFKYVVSVCGPVLGNRVSYSQDTASLLGETMTALRGTTKGCGSPDEQVIHSSSAYRHVIGHGWCVRNRCIDTGTHLYI